tara:strand:- start:461 stop:565 length:105 start_codon:yes stop_codon:yes gene_type:complete
MIMFTILFILFLGIVFMIEMTDIKKEKEKRFGKK